MPEHLTLYTAKVCPYAQRVELALEEAGAKYRSFEVDLQNKPEWYAPLVNPASKVPAVAYGGPIVPPEKPSPDSTKIAESLVLLEFVADLYPEVRLLPEDPVLRAKVRFFNDAVSTKFVPGWAAFLFQGANTEGLFTGAEAIQNLLSEGGKFAVANHYTIADSAILPFLGRLEVLASSEIGAFEEGQGQKVLEVLKSPRFTKLWNYYESLKTRPSFQVTFNESVVKTILSKRFSRLGAPKQAA